MTFRDPPPKSRFCLPGCKKHVKDVEKLRCTNDVRSTFQKRNAIQRCQRAKPVTPKDPPPLPKGIYIKCKAFERQKKEFSTIELCENIPEKFLNLYISKFQDKHMSKIFAPIARKINERNYRLKHATYTYFKSSFKSVSCSEL